MQAKIVLRNAIKEIPDSVSFRLELLRICGLFPFDSVKDIDGGLKDGIFNDVKKQQWWLDPASKIYNATKGKK